MVFIEATVGLEIPIAALLAMTGIAVAVVNPRQARNSAKAIGVLPKTDAIDAFVLARFAQAVRPPVQELKFEEIKELKAVTGFRVATAVYTDMGIIDIDAIDGFVVRAIAEGISKDELQAATGAWLRFYDQLHHVYV